MRAHSVALRPRDHVMALIRSQASASERTMLNRAPRSHIDALTVLRIVAAVIVAVNRTRVVVACYEDALDPSYS